MKLSEAVAMVRRYNSESNPTAEGLADLEKGAIELANHVDPPGGYGPAPNERPGLASLAETYAQSIQNTAHIEALTSRNDAIEIASKVLQQNDVLATIIERLILVIASKD